MENNLFNTQAEQIILGTCIMNNAELAKVADILEAKHFYELAHQAIWERFIEMASDGVANQVTLKNFFDSNEEIKKAGGALYLSTLLSEASLIVSIRHYANQIIELWQKRELKALLKNALDNLLDKKFGSVAATLENEIAGLLIQEPKKKTQHIEEVIRDIDVEESNGLSSKFVPTGFKKLDEILNGGIYAQQLVILGARPSVGKTSWAQAVILNSSISGKKCLFLSLEVDKKNVFIKFLSNFKSIAPWKILKRILNQSELQALITGKEQLKKMGIYVNDSSFLTISQIGRIIKTQTERQPIDLVVVDYVQIVRGEEVRGKNEATLIKETTSALKGFAKQYDISMLALAQINRKAVEGAKQEPTINDFKGSGGIEEDADVAVILHRDRTEGQEDSYFSRSGKLIVAKNRHGRTGEIGIDFDGEFGRFTETNF